jgi:glutamyl/glutaminyl-tRNA synthetase
MAIRKFKPGMRMKDGSIIKKIGQRRVEWGWFYPVDIDELPPEEAKKIKPTRKLTCRVRMDIQDKEGNMKDWKWIHIGVSDEIERGEWDGVTIIEWHELNPQ